MTFTANFTLEIIRIFTIFSDQKHTLNILLFYTEYDEKRARFKL